MLGVPNQRLTYAPKLLHENQEDENKVIRLGEPSTLSPKRWYWFCSNCGNREEMRKSDLKKTFVEHTFIISQSSAKKGMSRQEQEEVKNYFGGYSTSKESERDIPPPI